MFNLQIPQQVWIEMHDEKRDACDVIVQMEDGLIFTAVFVTLPYLRRQMDLTHAVCGQIPDAQAVRFAALETPHIVLDNLDRDTIEDTLDNLLTLESFGAIFTQVTEPAENNPAPVTESKGTRATQEVAAVVISDVLVVEA
jgi:hypothetical protein